LDDNAYRCLITKIAKKIVVDALSLARMFVINEHSGIDAKVVWHAQLSFWGKRGGGSTIHRIWRDKPFCWDGQETKFEN